jgi:hypothetical protein
MVRVFYEPPPYGPGTDLNRSPYGPGGSGGLFGRTLERLSKMPPWKSVGGAVLLSMAIAWIPLRKFTDCVFEQKNA